MDESQNVYWWNGEQVDAETYVELVRGRKNGMQARSHYASPEAIERQKARNGRVFTFEVYPDTKNEGMLYALEYVQDQEGRLFPAIAYILHDKDVWEEDGEGNELQDDGTFIKVEHKKGDLKKPHYHVVIKMRNTTSETSMEKFFCNAVKVFKVESIDSYLQYLLHRTPESRHKYQYPDEALYCTKSLRTKVLGKKTNFVQFGELLEDVSQGRPYAHTYIDILHSDRPAQEKEEMLDLLFNKGLLLIQAGNQCVNRQILIAQMLNNEVDSARRSRFYTQAPQMNVEEVFGKLPRNLASDVNLQSFFGLRGDNRKGVTK